MKLQEVPVSAAENTAIIFAEEEMSTKEIDRLKKVTRRRSIEEYVEKRKFREKYGDLAELYEIEFS